VKTSFTFAAVSLPAAFVLSLILALSLNEIGRSRPVFMGMLLIPWAISPVVTGYMWRWLFNDTFGLINHLLFSMGVIDQYLPWLAVPGTAIAATIVANIWRFLPYMSIMFLAGLQGIPHDLYEAADVDGASTFHKFIWITLSELRPVIVVVLLFSTIWMLNDFALIFIMTEGGPAKATQVLPITIYRMAFEALRLGRGAAASVLLMVFLLGLSLFYIRRLFGREEISS
jgi:multiple sugar transport system permease protein